ncbi:MAG: cell division protein FtsZ [Thermoplasmata archaeon]|nr:cell division protein FtsZ [Thermoplasmata archaeon]
MKSLIKEALARAEVRATQVPTPTSSGDIVMETPEDKELEEVLKSLKTNIKIVGCGGAGSNTITRLMEEGVYGSVELIAANTDAQHLLITHANRKILLGKRITRGLGAGALPQIGEEAAREAEDKIREVLQGADMVFITCGLGGGTGTGSAHVIAQIAKELGALTIAICTLPFTAEGRSRYENAMWGLEKLRDTADTVITIPNDKLLELVPRLPLTQAFKFADEVLMRAIKGLTEMITKPGLVNLDFNDLKTVMKGGGVAMIGLGESEGTGEERALEALEDAINSPLLEVDISTATGVLVNVVGSPDMTISEAERAVEELHKKVAKNARIIWGCAIDPTYDRRISVLVVATGVKSKQIHGKLTEEELKAQYGVDVIR